MARPTDAQRILKVLSNTLGGKATPRDLSECLNWTLPATEAKVKRGVQAGILFYSATTGMVTRKRKSASPDKGKVQSRRALGRNKTRPTTPQAKAPHGIYGSMERAEQLELPLAVTQTITESQASG